MLPTLSEEPSSPKTNTPLPPTQPQVEKPSTSSAFESHSDDQDNNIDLENIFNFIEMLKILDESNWNMDFVNTLEKTRQKLKAMLDFIPTNELILRHKELD